MSAIHVGLIGYGMAARVMHAPFLATTPLYKVAAVMERHKEDSKALFPDVKVARTIEELLNSHIELVVITTPNETHVPYAIQALEAGMHVVLEKPFTITSADAQLLIDTAAKVRRTVSVFHNRRYVADFLTIRQILQQQLLGNVHEYEAHYDRYRPELKANAWREENLPGSGILYDLGPHLIDQALCLFGLPKHITADIKTQRPEAKVDDYFDIQLHYDYTKVILKAGMLVREPGARYAIHGTAGSFVKYGEDPQEAILKTGQLPLGKDWGKEHMDDYGLLHTTVNDKEFKEKYPSLQGNFGLYYDNLYKAIREGKPLLEKAEHGFNTIRIIELAKESSRVKATIACEGLKDVSY
ncbi:Predicted dehydrogenase [Filimonas lacunae]|uniref:Predicted dehydrogenase n=1 Tax=Filimonas lacunae TaxID=477680 RepID=A0A1N7PEJ3_9BACT|nr:oxidoreductase [Filimonas lacunae]SIT09053.1 Predicted dehydrogenase [Filimonas lacunae]